MPHTQSCIVTHSTAPLTALFFVCLFFRRQSLNICIQDISTRDVDKDFNAWKTASRLWTQSAEERSWALWAQIAAHRAVVSGPVLSSLRLCNAEPLQMLLICWSLLYSAILRSRADSLRSICDSTWVNIFYSTFLNIRRSGVLTALTWLMPHVTAAVSARSVYTIQPCTMSLHAKPDT